MIENPNIEPVSDLEQKLDDQKQQASVNKYFCICGYDANGRKNRLTTHQAQFCKMITPTASANFVFPICGITKTYEAIKSHLRQFTKDRKNKTRTKSQHAAFDTKYHAAALEKFKTEFGPQKNI